MRAWSAVLVALLLVLSGCVTQVDENDDPEATSGATPDNSLPSAIQDSRTVQIGLSPVEAPTDEACPVEAPGCFEYTFSTGIDAVVQARLEWTDARNDFDLLVESDDGTIVAQGDDDMLADVAEIETELSPGTYNLTVVARSVTQDTYDLEAHFGYP